MNREVHVRFWESAGLRCPAPLTYLRAYATGSEARLGIGRWIAGYNTTRPHQALGYQTPDEVYRSPPVARPAPAPIDVAA
jgi:putative transposase